MQQARLRWAATRVLCVLSGVWLCAAPAPPAWGRNAHARCQLDSFEQLKKLDAERVTLERRIRELEDEEATRPPLTAARQKELAELKRKLTELRRARTKLVTALDAQGGADKKGPQRDLEPSAPYPSAPPPHDFAPPPHDPPPPPHPLAPPPHPSPQPQAIGFDTIDQISKRLPWGELAFSAPEQMTVGESAVVHVALSDKETLQQLKQLIVESGRFDSGRIQMNYHMVLHLTGRSFNVDAETDEEQFIGDNAPAEWKWVVSPTEAGSHILTLTAYAVVAIDGKDTKLQVKTAEREIAVRVDYLHTALAFAGENVQWLWTALLLPFAGLLWSKLRKQKPARGAADEDRAASAKSKKPRPAKK